MANEENDSKIRKLAHATAEGYRHARHVWRTTVTGILGLLFIALMVYIAVASCVVLLNSPIQGGTP